MAEATTDLYYRALYIERNADWPFKEMSQCDSSDEDKEENSGRFLRDVAEVTSELVDSPANDK